MKQRIFRSICAVTLLCVLLCYACVMVVLYKISFDTMVSAIRDESVYIEASLNNGDTSALTATKATFTRLTIIAPDGTVIFDSLEDPAQMENHADRPEFTGALQNGAAESRRYSETMATQSYYRAVRLQNGQVIRVSGDMDSVWVMALRYVPLVGLVSAVAVFVSIMLARWLSKRIAVPINSLDLEHPLSNTVYEELAPLLRRMEQQRLEIQAQLAQMEAHRREFDAITEHMQEGLILLCADAKVLSINRSAQQILQLRKEECIGHHILYMIRAQEVQAAVEQGLRGSSAEALLRITGRSYQILCNPVADEQKIKGAVLLLLDVTDKYQAEQLRREFTANVSHELKTPLTSISGFAEIIQNGMAKPEDIPAFAQRIYNETRRLITLVEDILQLSRLDEQQSAGKKEPVDLLALARQVETRLRPVAERQGIALAVSGDHDAIAGVPHILEEIIGNLIENAIKYNKPQGSVTVTVTAQPDTVQLAVADTGIGIPAEHQERVFERFYRVDKSHSKETGGTGLGLSIVKHGALFHHARLELDSKEGAGTTVRLTFPKNAAITG